MLFSCGLQQKEKRGIHAADAYTLRSSTCLAQHHDKGTAGFVSASAELNLTAAQLPAWRLPLLPSSRVRAVPGQQCAPEHSMVCAEPARLRTQEGSNGRGTRQAMAVQSAVDHSACDELH